MTANRGVLVADGTAGALVEDPQTAGWLDDLGDGRVRLRTDDGRTVEALVTTSSGMGGPSTIEVVVDGWRYELSVEGEERASIRARAAAAGARVVAAHHAEVRSQIPGRVVAVDAAEGAIVARGERLLVVEAMKMQNEIRAPREGVVVRVAVTPGSTVEVGAVMVVIG